VINLPLVLALLWVLGATLDYQPPIIQRGLSNW
jgi:hypothetical protein